MPKLYGQACPVAKSLELVGERWTLLIVRDLLRGPRRFQDLLESLTGIAPNVLSERLKLMEQHGLVERRFYSEHPPRAEYLLSGKGQDLGVVVSALASWGSRYTESATRYVHAECGESIELGFQCPHCGTNVERGAVRLEHGVASQ
jgi:DNA-binding HxlR family transcriptional regulator